MVLIVNIAGTKIAIPLGSHNICGKMYQINSMGVWVTDQLFKTTKLADHNGMVIGVVAQLEIMGVVRTITG